MILKNITRLVIAIAIGIAVAGNASAADKYREARNLIIEGNRLFKQERWSEAEVKYQKALEVDPTSEVAQFNLASALLRQGKISDLQDPNSSMSRARNTFISLSADPKTSKVKPELIEKSFYNLGNMAYDGQNYREAIEMYKGALRINPSNEQARENLRLAQLKLDQQQNQDNQNQQQQQQQQQDQQQQDQQDGQNPEQPENKQNQPPQQQPSNINDQNMEQILKTMENEEAATRRRIQLQQGKQGKRTNNRVTGNPW